MPRVFVVIPTKRPTVYSTAYTKWTADTRETLIPCMAYIGVPENRPAFWVPKLSDVIELGLLTKMLNGKTPVGRFMLKHGGDIYYRCDGGLYWKVFTNFAPKFRLNGTGG